jgi:diguanylate cyclase (GGDEF)-like protein/PAS domain S-box-containing protein
MVLVGDYQPNLFSLAPGLTSLAFFGLGALIWQKERASRVGTTFLLMALPVAWWLFAFAWVYSAADPVTALVWIRVAYLAVPLIPAGVYHFSQVVFGLERRRTTLIRAAWLVSLLFVAAAVGSDALIAGVYSYDWGYYPRYGALGGVFVAYFVAVMVVALYAYWDAWRRATDDIGRRRVRNLLLAFGVGYLGALDFLPKFHVDILPLGFLAILFFQFVAAHTVRRYRLVDLSASFAAREIVATMADPLIVCDADHRIRVVNDATCAVFGYAQEELLGRPVGDLADPAGDHRRRLIDAVASPTTRDAETVFRSRDGDAIDVSVSVSHLWDEVAGSVGTVVIARDIRERKRVERQLRHNAFFDALTELPNRALLMDRLQVAFARGRRKPDYRFGVLFLDVDRFKLVNDGLGHEAGDLLLTAIARRLEIAKRPSDTVGRMGGDEFIILLDDIRDVGDAAHVAERQLRELERPFEVAGSEVFVSASIGIAVSSGGYDKPEDLVRDADTALNRAKESGKGRYEVFDQAMHRRAIELLALEAEMRRALERDEFVLHYQPIVAAATGRITGVEALVRWRHPQRGLLQPHQFVPVAEETGLIVPLGSWVLHTACAQARTWLDAGLPAARMAVNISARQFRRPDFGAQVADVLHLTGLRPAMLELELTESALIEDVDETIAMLRALEALGVRISIDDFGTGYSSLAYLKRLPIHTIKIDRAFVQDVERDPDNAAISSAVVALARSLKLAVLAEGVETKEALAFFRALQCDAMQGFHFSRPVAASAIATMLAEASRPL